MAMKFEELSSKPDFSEIQPEILKYWKDDRTFEKSVEKPGAPEIVFYDGPPFPTGKPHHGTVLVSFTVYDFVCLLLLVFVIIQEASNMPCNAKSADEQK